MGETKDREAVDLTKGIEASSLTDGGLLLGRVGAEIDIFSDNGGVLADSIDTFLRHGVQNAVTAGTAPFTGVFRPETTFAGFVGASPAGNWRLRLRDDFNGDIGTLDAYEIAMCVMP